MMFLDPFAPLYPRAGAFLAPVDVTVSERDVVMTFDLPGVKSEDLDIEVLDRELVLRGERKRPEVGDGVAWAHMERPFGAFERHIRLPEGVDPDAVTASLTEGCCRSSSRSPSGCSPSRSRSRRPSSSGSSRPAPPDLSIQPAAARPRRPRRRGRDRGLLAALRARGDSRRPSYDPGVRAGEVLWLHRSLPSF